MMAVAGCFPIYVYLPALRLRWSEPKVSDSCCQSMEKKLQWSFFLLGKVAGQIYIYGKAASDGHLCTFLAKAGKR